MVKISQASFAFTGETSMLEFVIRDGNGLKIQQRAVAEKDSFKEGSVKRNLHSGVRLQPPARLL